MLNKLFSNAYARVRFLRFSDMRPFLTKVFNVSMSFILIFTLAFVTIETIDPEPAVAASWDCLDSNGRPIAFQTAYSGGDLYVKRYNFSTNSESTTIFSGSGFSGSGEINASFMDLDGNLYVQRKTSTSNGAHSRLYLVNPTGSPTLVDNSSAGDDLTQQHFLSTMDMSMQFLEGDTLLVQEVMFDLVAIQVWLQISYILLAILILVVGQ